MGAGHTRRAALAVLLVLASVARARAQAPQLDPLPSGNDGVAKRSITGFVARAATLGTTDFVPPVRRPWASVSTAQARRRTCEEIPADPAR